MMPDNNAKATGTTPYVLTLRRAIFPHIWLNEGRPLLGWRWIRFDDRPEHGRWLYTYRMEVGLLWLAVLLVLFWATTDLHRISHTATGLAETLSGLWIVYGLILNRAVRWVTPNLPPPRRKRKNRGDGEK